MATQENKELFKRVKYNKADIERDASQDVLANGAIIKVVIDSVKYQLDPTRGKGPGEDFIQMCTIYPIDPRDGQSRLKRFRLGTWNVLPLVNPDYENTHVPPDWANGMWSQFCQAFIPERHKGAPQSQDGQMMFDGKKIDPSTVAQIEMERSDARLKEALELLQAEGKDLLRRTCYATVKHGFDKKGVFRINADKLRAELGPNESLTDYKDLITKMVPGSATGEKKEAASNGNGAAPEEKSSGRRSSRRSR